MKRVIIAACVIGVLSSCGDAKKGKGKDKAAAVETEHNLPASNGMVIAYFENDSIPEHFDFYKKTLEVLDGKRKAFENEMKAYQADYQTQVNSFQQQYNALSPKQIEAKQQALAGKEKSILEYQQSVGGKLQEEEFESNKLLVNKMEMYSKEYAKKNGINILMFKQTGGQVVYADSTMDVTMDFIKYMNEREKALDEGK